METRVATLRKVLVVDDHEPTLKWLARNTRDFDVLCASCPDEVWSIVAQHELYCAFIDVLLKDSNGIHLVRPLAMLQPGLRIAMVTHWPDASFERLAEEAGAVTFLEKPVSIDRAVPELMKIPTSCAIAARTSGVHRSRALAEREHAEAVLEACGGNKSEAARRLRVSRQTLQQMLAKPRPLS